jgi:hypothetical protein
MVMFLLMSNMAFSMTQPAIYANCIFFVSFAFLTFFYGREISKDMEEYVLAYDGDEPIEIIWFKIVETIKKRLATVNIALQSICFAKFPVRHIYLS